MTPRLLVQRSFMWWTLYGGFEKRYEARSWTKKPGEGIGEVFWSSILEDDFLQPSSTSG